MEGKAIQFIQKKIKRRIDTALILGSGLGFIGDHIEKEVVIPYDEIPGFMASTVKGHSGKMIIGTIKEKSVLILQGRSHYYEGISMEKLVFPVKVLKGLGVKNLIVTAASGGVNPSFKEGDIIIIKDHINYVFNNPFIKRNTSFDPSFFLDTSKLYNKKIRHLIKGVAKEQKISVKEGIYFYMSGPSYETPAEINMINKLGGDMVGMSTVPEALEAHKSGIKVAGISYISNMGAGISEKPLDHDDVMETMRIIKEDMLKLMIGVLNVEL